MFYNKGFSLELLSSYFAGVSPQTCQYHGVSKFCLLYLLARDVSQKSGNCRITHPNVKIFLLWYEIGYFYTHSFYIYTYIYAYRKREEERNNVMMRRSTEV